jgi:NADPH:quinone reductase-like Zn-dependent oxidoreductase
MQALVYEEVQSPLVVKEVDDPTPKPGEVVVSVKAAALNHRDVFITQGLYPGIELPAILGSDGCGVVESDGAWKGKEVVIDPGDGWGEDEHKNGPDYNILGMPRPGTFAEKVAVPVESLHERPSHLSDAEAAALPLAHLTAWRVVMTRAQLKPEDKVLVTGIGGGVALAVLQIAKAHGARVWVTSSKQDKIDAAVKMGAEGGFLYTEERWGRTARKTMGGGGADVVIDGAGGEGFDQCVDALAPGGRIGVYGSTCGRWPKLLPPRLFFKQASIVTSTMGSPREFVAMVDFVKRHRIKPVVDKTFPLETGAEAFAYLDSGAQQGKVVLTCV